MGGQFSHIEHSVGIWSLNEELTISPDYFKKSVAMIKNMFLGMLSKVQDQQQIQEPEATEAKSSNITKPSGQSHGDRQTRSLQEHESKLNVLYVHYTTAFPGNL